LNGAAAIIDIPNGAYEPKTAAREAINPEIK